LNLLHEQQKPASLSDEAFLQLRYACYHPSNNDIKGVVVIKRDAATLTLLTVLSVLALL
jgi:hypothetical protein